MPGTKFTRRFLKWVYLSNKKRDSVVLIFAVMRNISLLWEEIFHQLVYVVQKCKIKLPIYWKIRTSYISLKFALAYSDIYLFIYFFTRTDTHVSFRFFCQLLFSIWVLNCKICGFDILWNKDMLKQECSSTRPFLCVMLAGRFGCICLLGKVGLSAEYRIWSCFLQWQSWKILLKLGVNVLFSYPQTTDNLMHCSHIWWLTQNIYM